MTQLPSHQASPVTIIQLYRDLLPSQTTHPIAILFPSPLHTHKAMSRYNFPLYHDTAWAVAQNSFCTFFFFRFSHFFFPLLLLKNTQKKYVHTYIYIYIYIYIFYYYFFFHFPEHPNRFIKTYFIHFSLTLHIVKPKNFPLLIFFFISTSSLPCYSIEMVACTLLFIHSKIL